MVYEFQPRLVARDAKPVVAAPVRIPNHRIEHARALDRVAGEASDLHVFLAADDDFDGGNLSVNTAGGRYHPQDRNWQEIIPLEKSGDLVRGDLPARSDEAWRIDVTPFEENKVPTLELDGL